MQIMLILRLKLQ